MIRGIDIERLRGIRTAHLTDLLPLTVLVGPSGSGKSTILDALLIATSGAPGDAIGRVIRRRAELPAGGPWLFERRHADARIELHGDAQSRRSCSLSWTPHPAEDLVRKLPEREQNRRPIQIDCDVDAHAGRFRSRTVISVSNQYVFDLQLRDDNSDRRQFQSEPGAWLCEPAAGATHEALDRVYSRALREGRLEGVVKLVRDVLDGVIDLRVETVEDDPVDRPILSLVFEHGTVPVAGAGSGVYALIRLALDLAQLPGGMALVEEPEIHQHPAGIHRTAKVLLAAMRRGVQVVVSTHSLDLIDSLVAEADANDLERLCVMRVVLDEGTLRCSRYPGPMVVTARESLGEDLR
ncbi:MAG: AAA family ATPase [Polyangiaceae bacterium]|nr:AAA family ATPase [Polyangiaceae bacterium]